MFELEILTMTYSTPQITMLETVICLRQFKVFTVLETSNIRLKSMSKSAEPELQQVIL